MILPRWQFGTGTLTLIVANLAIFFVAVRYYGWLAILIAWLVIGLAMLILGILRRDLKLFFVGFITISGPVGWCWAAAMWYAHTRNGRDLRDKCER